MGGAEIVEGPFHLGAAGDVVVAFRSFHGGEGSGTGGGV
jgi:hypothetical protein